VRSRFFAGHQRRAQCGCYTKIKLAQIAMQVAFVTVLIDAFHASFEQREEAFDCVCVNIAANVFAALVIDEIVAFMSASPSLR
jgi:hypothetical protein